MRTLLTTLIFLVSSIALGAPTLERDSASSFATATHPISVELGAGWSIISRNPTSQVWQRTASSEFGTVSVIAQENFENPAYREKARGIQEKKFALVTKSGKTDYLAELNKFSLSRQNKIKALGLKNWILKSANLSVHKGSNVPAFELSGTYDDDQGLTYCFTERQLDLGSHQIQELATTRMTRAPKEARAASLVSSASRAPASAPDSRCDYRTNAEWLNQIVAKP